jgi:hypothetical protein
MAFGRRTTVGAGTTGTVQPRSRGWRNVGYRRRGAASTIATNKVSGGSKTTMTDMRAASGRRMSVAGAVIGEKFARFGADVKLGFYTISHPAHRLRRAAAREQNINVKAAASGNDRVLAYLGTLPLISNAIYLPPKSCTLAIFLFPNFSSYAIIRKTLGPVD